MTATPKLFTISLVCGLFISVPYAHADPTLPQLDTAYQTIVKDFVAAFNQQSTEEMGRFVTDDVQWLSIDGQKLSVETNNKAELLESMTHYFASCPTCRSTVSNFVVGTQRVSTLETAYRLDESGQRYHEQQSLSVYEFSGQLIQRVYYFPLE